VPGYRVSGFLSAERKLGARVKGVSFPLGREETSCEGEGCQFSSRPRGNLVPVFMRGKQGYVSWAVQLYGCHVDEVVRTTDRRINGNRKHTLLGPAPVKESMCWVLNACSVDNERYGNASRVRVGDGCGYGPYIVDGRLVVLK
jgi:hypothetical protein